MGKTLEVEGETLKVKVAQCSISVKPCWLAMEDNSVTSLPLPLPTSRVALTSRLENSYMGRAPKDLSFHVTNTIRCSPYVPGRRRVCDVEIISYYELFYSPITHCKCISPAHLHSKDNFSAQVN